MVFLTLFPVTQKSTGRMIRKHSLSSTSNPPLCQLNWLLRLISIFRRMQPAGAGAEGDGSQNSQRTLIHWLNGLRNAVRVQSVIAPPGDQRVQVELGAVPQGARFGQTLRQL
jgi:hypothetical protein